MTLNDVTDVVTIIVSVGGICAGYFRLSLAIKIIDYRLTRLENMDGEVQ